MARPGGRRFGIGVNMELLIKWDDKGFTMASPEEVSAQGVVDLMAGAVVSLAAGLETEPGVVLGALSDAVRNLTALAAEREQAQEQAEPRRASDADVATDAEDGDVE